MAGRLMPGRLTTRLAIALIGLMSLALAASIGATAWLVQASAKAQALALARQEMAEIASKLDDLAARSAGLGPAADALLADQAALIVRERAQLSAVARGPGCERATSDPRIILVRTAAGIDGTRGVAWPAGGGDVVHLKLAQGAVCLAAPASAWGVERRFGDIDILIARVLPVDRTLYLRATAIGFGVFIVFALLALAVAALFNAGLNARVRALNAVLDAVESSGFTVRATDGGGGEFALLADHVNGMIARLGTLAGGLSSLAIHIAHDLRSPLVVAARKLEALETMLGGHEAVADVRREVEALLHRCVQLLDIVRIETQARDGFTRVDLAAQLELLVADVFDDEAEAAGKHITLATAPAAITARTDIVQRMIANLLQNAIKFADPGSTIKVALATAGERAVLSVDNDGPEVPADRLESIFDPHVAASVTAGGGYGLGLPFVRAAARRYGGDAIAEPRPGGFRIAVKLPLA